MRRVLRLTMLVLMLMLMLLIPVRVQAACSLAQPPNMNLGSYTGTQSNIGSTNLTVTCTSGSANYTIGLSGGVSGNTSARTMQSGATNLNYELFRDAARTLNWGNVAGTDTYSGSGNVATATIPIYPRITSGQFVAPGTYVDTVATASRTFTVTATVQPTCNISSTIMAFGIYTGIVKDTTATLSITCSNTTPYNVGLSAGNANAASVTTRRMQGPDSRGLSYVLFQDSGRTQNWGNTVGTDTVAGTGSGNTQSLTVNGRIAEKQLVAPGNYSDTIIATVTY